jgi:hypothetical protein
LLSLGKQSRFLINRLCAEIRNAPPGDGEAFFGYGVQYLSELHMLLFFQHLLPPLNER